MSSSNTFDLLGLDNNPPTNLNDIIIHALPNSGLSQPSQDFVRFLLNETSLVPHILTYFTDLNTSIKPDHIPSFVKHIVGFIKRTMTKKRVAYDLLEVIRFILLITLKPHHPKMEEIMDQCLWLLEIQIQKPNKSCISMFFQNGENQSFWKNISA